MDNYIGKHLLIDCYNCRSDEISSSENILHVLEDSTEKIGMKINDTFYHEDTDEIIAAAYGIKSHVCIHAYPLIGFAAVDIYSFSTDLIPSRTMAVLRSTLHPEKIRATSVKRGNINPDMKPSIKSKSTALHKFKNTGQQVKNAGQKVANYMRHKTDKRDTLGPE
ncbi:S-adenosylmethionine decarboxylase [Dialister sp.]|uniref:S-adenosylmethionine decarboxylase n=1 Tax=Dialister sp. TaxID=1955814 RepID=UPI002E800041|nr:S-adenosylmethionine decarboxylase [Dialister sp.]MEE3451971.1 S-adenosylmethionine decarboxylase [Dialister sp.]